MNIALIVLFSLLSFQPQSTSKACLIVARHQHKFGENATRFKAHRPFDYVEGSFPDGIKFKNELGDKDVREIQAKGGKIVVLSPEYKMEELKDAREQCKSN